VRVRVTVRVGVKVILNISLINRKKLLLKFLLTLTPTLTCD
jgi:hypothetical protein